MVYINSRGEIVDRPAFSWFSPFAIFWAALNFISLFFRTLVQPNGPSVSGSSRNSSSRGSGGGAPRMGGFKRAGGPSAPPCGMGGG